MLCEFCRHEFDDGLTECPYCHKKVDIEAKSLTREERDNFAGTTIEMEDSSGFKVYRLGGSLMTWIIFALIVLGIIFFVLPAFLFIGIAGAVAGAIIILLSKLFQ